MGLLKRGEAKKMDEILITFVHGQAEGMRAWALKEDNEKKRLLMLAIADTYSLLHDQLVELGQMQPRPLDET
jgi:hypothetical protein